MGIPRPPSAEYSLGQAVSVPTPTSNVAAPALSARLWASFTASKPAAPLRRYHFHGPGLVYILVTLFIAMGAINSQNNLLFAALGLAIGGLLISGIISGGALLGVR